MWILKSNRIKHLAVGTVVFVFYLLLAYFLEKNLLCSAILSLITTTMIAGAGECKDKMWGGQFDWLDLSATILVPLVLTVVIIILSVTW
jgi:hypothetical protein